MLANLVTGRYHRPTEEERIFLFTDMQRSTTVAERLGHVRYFELLADYFADLSDAIADHGGQVYQYVGDEIVVSWPVGPGEATAACLHCLFAMRDDLAARAAWYQNAYGWVPSFRAGLHVGRVTTGEIGILKKEIIFTGEARASTPG
ncbi:MAG: adenylate/guanylate cyclase domain-containing protein [Longimicrobiales bacterium]